MLELTGRVYAMAQRVKAEAVESQFEAVAHLDVLERIQQVRVGKGAGRCPLITIGKGT